MPANTERKSPPDIGQWVREQFKNANQFLAEQGIVVDAVVSEQSRYLPPIVAVWKLKDRHKKGYWVLGGDMPTDVIAESAAEDARAAIRHFSLNWQMQAANIRTKSTSSAEESRFADILENKAEQLYALADREALWS